MRRVSITVVWLTLLFFAAAQKPATQEKDSTEADTLAKQELSALYSAVRHSDAPSRTSDPAEKDAGLRYNVHMSDSENRWVALFHHTEDPDYTYGFVYIDPQAGFTLHYFGRFTIDANGNYRVAHNPLPPDKISLKIRLDQNGIAALLPPKALVQLGIPEKPDWLKFYEDKVDSITHRVHWGFFYNGIGDSERALSYLESAYKEQPNAPRVVFELTYAYNATERPDDALRVAKGEFARNPKDELLCREIAFAHLRLKNYKDATDQYQACIALCSDSEAGLAEKSELAMNLSAAYGALSDTTNHDVWLTRAKSWAPKGSAIYKHFHPEEE